MRFLMMVMLPEEAHADYEAGYFGEPEAFAEMARYNERMQQAGIVLGMDGLHPTSHGARVSFSGNGATVTDGPFPESKELFGGYWIIQTDTKEQAVEWARQAPMSVGEVIVLRRIADMEDYPAEAQEAAGFNAR